MRKSHFDVKITSAPHSLQRYASGLKNFKKLGCHRLANTFANLVTSQIFLTHFIMRMSSFGEIVTFCLKIVNQFAFGSCLDCISINHIPWLCPIISMKNNSGSSSGSFQYGMFFVLIQVVRLESDVLLHSSLLEQFLLKLSLFNSFLYFLKLLKF